MKKLIFSVLTVLFVNIAIAAGSTFETGKDGLVIKEGSCYAGGGWVWHSPKPVDTFHSAV